MQRPKQPGAFDEAIIPQPKSSSFVLEKVLLESIGWRPSLGCLRLSLNKYCFQGKTPLLSFLALSLGSSTLGLEENRKMIFFVIHAL